MIEDKGVILSVGQELRVNEDEPRMDTNKHEVRGIFLPFPGNPFSPVRPLADPSQAFSNPLVALRGASCPFVDIFFWALRITLKCFRQVSPPPYRADHTRVKQSEIDNSFVTLVSRRG